MLLLTPGTKQMPGLLGELCSRPLQHFTPYLENQHGFYHTESLPSTKWEKKTPNHLEQVPRYQ